MEKDNELKARQSKCDCCSATAIHVSPDGKALCAKCAGLIKSGSAQEPGLKQAADVMTSKLTKD